MGPGRPRSRHNRSLWSALLVVLLLAASLFIAGGTAIAAPTPVGLGTATTFAIRAGDQITNVPTSTINGDTGLSPASGTFYTDGTFCSQVTGTVYSVDSTATISCEVVNPGFMTTVRSDASAAFTHTSNLPGATPTGGANNDLAGLTLVAGLYSFGHGTTSNLGGTLTLDAQGDPNAVWIFQASSDLVTAPSSVVTFANLPPGVSAARMACNVVWTVQSSATLGTSSSFVGTILASASITVLNAVTVNGRLLAANQGSGAGLVSLIADTINVPTGCAALPAGTGGGPATPPTSAPTGPTARFTG